MASSKMIVNFIGLDAVKKRFLEKELYITELEAKVAGLEATLARVKKWTDDPIRHGDYGGKIPRWIDLDSILSDIPAPIAVEACDIQTDGTAGWYEVTACWPGSDDGTEIDKEVTVIVLAKGGTVESQ